MGLWDREEQHGLRLDEEFALGVEFVVTGTAPAPELVLNTGELVPRVELTVRRLDGDTAGEPYKVRTAASAIVAMMAEAEESDFPLIAKLAKVRTKHANDALVLRLVRPFEG